MGLVFAHQVVATNGENVLDLIDDLQTDSVEWLREFDPRYFFEPEPRVPVIRSIEITATARYQENLTPNQPR